MKMDKFLLSHTNGTVFALELDRDNLFSEFKKLTDINWVEHVVLSNGLSVLIDVHGKFYDEPLEVNLLASMFYPGTPYGDPIVGPALFCKREWSCEGYDLVCLILIILDITFRITRTFL